MSVKRIDQFPAVPSVLTGAMLIETDPDAGTRAYARAVANAGTFTPTARYTTPGTSSFAYAVQDGSFHQLNKAVWFQFEIDFTPTLGTGSGNLEIVLDALPPPVKTCQVVVDLTTNGVTWPAATTQLLGVVINSGGVAALQLRSIGPGATRASWGTTQFPDAAARRFFATGVFKVA